MFILLLLVEEVEDKTQLIEIGHLLPAMDASPSTAAIPLSPLYAMMI